MPKSNTANKISYNLSENEKKGILELVNDSINDFGTHQFNSLRDRLDASYTLLRFHGALNHGRRSALTSSTLSNLLHLRWLLVQNTNTQYLHDFSNFTNLFCIKVAKELSPLVNIPYLLLLMPSLATLKAQDYLTSSYSNEDAIELRETILCNRNFRLINIPDVLSFAQSDGRLKHNSLLQGKALRLNAAEIKRMTSRHPSIETAYQTIQELRALKFEGFTVGAFLNRLIEGLRQGDVFHDGEEFDAGNQANIAILNFSLYLETLDHEIKKQLMTAGRIDPFTGEHQIIETYWQRLIRVVADEKSAEEITEQAFETIYCVQLIAVALEKILEANPELYDLPSYGEDNQEFTNQFKGLQSRLRETLHSATTNLAKVEKHLYYKELRNDFLDVTAINFIADQYAKAKQEGDLPLVALSEKALIDIAETHPSITIAKALKAMPIKLRRQFAEVTGCYEELEQTVPPRAKQRLFETNANPKKRTRDKITPNEPNSSCTIS